MRRMRIGDKVRCFLDARIQGEVINIVYLKSNKDLMFGGVPSEVAYADIKMKDGNVIRMRTTDLSMEQL